MDDLSVVLAKMQSEGLKMNWQKEQPPKIWLETPMWNVKNFIPNLTHAAWN